MKEALPMSRSRAVPRRNAYSTKATVAGSGGGDFGSNPSGGFRPVSTNWRAYARRRQHSGDADCFADTGDTRFGDTFCIRLRRKCVMNKLRERWMIVADPPATRDVLEARLGTEPKQVKIYGRPTILKTQNADSNEGGSIDLAGRRLPARFASLS